MDDTVDGKMVVSSNILGGKLEISTDVLYEHDQE